MGSIGLFACVNESKERNTRRSYIHIKILDTSHKEVDLTLGNDITTTSSESEGTHCQIILSFNPTSPIMYPTMYPYVTFSKLAHSKEPLPGSHSVLQQRLRSVSQVSTRWNGFPLRLSSPWSKGVGNPHYL